MHRQRWSDAAVAGNRVEPEIPHYIDLAEYQAAGGYQTLVACVSGERALDSVLAAMEDSGLRGLGGAGFPTGRKWRIVRNEPAPRLMAVNIDEGEPERSRTAIIWSATRIVFSKAC